MRKLLLIIIVGVSNFVCAQMSGSIGIADPRSMALGKSSVISSRGVYAIHHNPANLVLYDSHSVEISTLLPIPTASLFIGNEYLSLEDYNYFFGGIINKDGERVGRYLNDSDKQKLLTAFDNGESHDAASSINLFSIAVKLANNSSALGFSITDIAGETGAVPADLVDLWLNGNELGRIYNLNGLNIKSFYLREYSISYSGLFKNFLRGSFDQFSVGLSLKLVHGFAYTNIEKSDITVKTLDDYSIMLRSEVLANMAFSKNFGINYDFLDEDREFSFTPFPEPAGSGFGLSFGINAQVNEAWSIGLALTDIGSIKWDNEPVAYRSSGSYTITGITDSTLTDSLEAYINPQGAFTDGFTTQLPTALRFGVGLDYKKLNKNFNGDLLIIFGYAQGFNDEPTNTTNPRFSLAAEWKLAEIIPIRSGFSFGGINKFEWGFGFGLDFGLLELNFATSDLISLLKGNQAKKNIFAFGSRWKF